MNKFRKYTDVDIIKTYKDILENQTLEHVEKVKKQFNEPKIKTNIWRVIKELSSIIDKSDPDNDLPQVYHSYQTANTILSNFFIDDELKKDISIREIFDDEYYLLPTHIRMNYPEFIHELYSFDDWSWLIVVGFIHNIGKILIKCGLEQWTVVGDTFPVGCKLHKNYVLHELHKNNKDYDKYDMFGIYELSCGLNNLKMSFGHCEYLANILEKNKTKIPPEGIYLIRFQSFYAWHTVSKNQRGYEYFANEYDWKMLPLLKLFQKCDLYSKSLNVKKLNFELIKNKYRLLVGKYLSDLIYI